MKIEVKATHRLTQARTPKYQTAGAAAIDVIAAIDSPILVATGKSVLIPTGIAINIQDPNVAAMLLPRSSTGHKMGLVLGNGTGLIDSDYQGEIFASVTVRPGHEAASILPGDRIAQLVFVPVIRVDVEPVQEFSTTTERGTGGFGSTGAQ